MVLSPGAIHLFLPGKVGGGSRREWQRRGGEAEGTDGGGCGYRDGQGDEDSHPGDWLALFAFGTVSRRRRRREIDLYNREDNVTDLGV
jgi:hypothetical protein